MKKLLAAALAPLALAASPALAATSFTSTFENVAGGPTTNGTYTNVKTADGWNAVGSGSIELQRRVAGAPSTGSGIFNGGNVFVELDSTANSSMQRTIDAGSYLLEFLYSPRPGVASTSNGIAVLLNGTLIDPPGVVAATGGADTSWSMYQVAFNANAASTLTFAARGTSDSLGGYLDNITLTAVPEPATWATMLVGFAMVGAGMRRRARSTRVVYA